MKRLRFSFLFALVAVVTNVAAQADDESKALAVLASDADAHDKAMACDLLGRVGTAEAVPVLAGLLDDEQLHDYARDGLERIADPAAGKALLVALETLGGNHLVGVIITLGNRGDVAAVPALAKYAKHSHGTASAAALSSLAQIASEDSAGVILEVLANADAEAKVSAARAALAAADHMERNGREEGAKKLRAAVADSDVPDYLKRAAAMPAS